MKLTIDFINRNPFISDYIFEMRGKQAAKKIIRQLPCFLFTLRPHGVVSRVKA